MTGHFLLTSTTHPRVSKAGNLPNRGNATSLFIPISSAFQKVRSVARKRLRPVTAPPCSEASLGHHLNADDINFTAGVRLPFTLPPGYPDERRVAAFMLVVLDLENHLVIPPIPPSPRPCPPPGRDVHGPTCMRHRRRPSRMSSARDTRPRHPSQVIRVGCVQSAHGAWGPGETPRGLGGAGVASPLDTPRARPPGRKERAE